MADTMTSTALQLRDIHGIDAVSWWPPAPGWWLIALAVAVVFISMTLVIRRLIKYPPGSWRADAHKALTRLRRNARTMPDKQVAADLSEILRRIAIARHGRKDTAGLSGNDWLTLLTDSDPNHYQWHHEAQLLLSLPYAPASNDSHQTQLQTLITAALRMVAASRKQQEPIHRLEAQDV